ncbi:hypothetical protein [Rubrivirga sp.]|uniref:hypothetical protein n=1 Tax=Rubrivirga sp. TaxID=1885344 RepID=UPI003C7915D2
MASRLPVSLFPARIARAVAERVQDVVAERTAPPVVTAVRREGLTDLGSRALAELHECVIEAEQSDLEGTLAVVGDCGAAIVAADARISAREVRVYGITPESQPDLEDAMTRHGFRPATTRITIVEAGSDLESAVIAVGYAPDDEAVALLAPELGAQGVLLVAGPGRSAVDALVEDGAFRSLSRGGVFVVQRA